MPPMCSPEKKNEDENSQSNGISKAYYDPRSDDSFCSDTDEEDAAVQNRMDQLIDDFPDFAKHFDLCGQVGQGTFSTVYVAIANRFKDKKFAVKHVVPTCHPDRIKFELECLKTIGGCDNVAGITLCLRNQSNVLFIMPYQQHDSFNEYVGSMDSLETSMYIKNLFTALKRVHQFNVIHRDIKPSNFLYDRSNRSYLLVDFGLAQKHSAKRNEVLYHSSTDGSKKRKRDPLSPVNDSSQRESRSKRMAATKAGQSSSREAVVPDCTTPASKAQKENEPSNLSKTLQFSRVQSSPDGLTSSPKGCGCYGKPQICSLCPLDKPMQASRAGTPGFRPPEVLLKYPNQTTSVDIWAAGIILLSILSNCVNFFDCPSDNAALLEVVTIFGSERIKKVAHKLGRYFVTSNTKQPLDLKKTCILLRKRQRIANLMEGEQCANCEQYVNICLCPNVPIKASLRTNFPDCAYDLLLKLLDPDPETRITAEAALSHPFLNM